MLFKKILLFSLFAFSFFFSSYAQEIPVRFEIKTPGNGLSVASGETVTLEIQGIVTPSWHVYGNPKGPGTGIPLTIELPEFPEAQVLYPAAPRFDVPELNEWVYAFENNFTLSVSFKIPESTSSGPLNVSIQVKGLACKTSCIPIRETLTTTLQITGSQGSSMPQSFFLYIILGLVAGLILNFLPCVLPVLSLKILSAISLGKDRARKAAFFYTLGVLSVFAVLASLMAFASFLWGQQFQNPLFLIGTGIFVTLFILSLFDVWHFGAIADVAQNINTSQEGYSGDFFKGILATLLATPCSGPFLGSTLSWASQQNPFVLFCVYFSIGLGMSLPFIAIVTIPALKKLLPKPGAWMTRFKEGSAFFMIATLVYLVFLLENNARIAALLIFVLTAFCGWVFSIAQSKTGKTIAVLLFLLGSFPCYQAVHSSPQAVEIREDTFSPDKVQALRAQGKNVVVDFTADWCPNCKLNEKTVLHTDEVQNIFKENNTVFLVADLSRKNEIAEMELKRLGGYSIPFLAVYPKNLEAPVKTIPDIYTKAVFLDFFKKSIENRE
jgi:thiol:disulfide interchange protein DsbD